LAKRLGLHKQTILDWLRKGLKPIKENTKPLLVRGADVRTFYLKNRGRMKIKENENYCPKCRRGVCLQKDSGNKFF
jgi:hypothetical protein